MSLSRIIEHHADRFADRLAISYGATEVTYGALRTRACAVAGALRDLGARRGDVVAVLLHNSLEFVDVMLGSAYAGTVFMPLNWRLAPPELEYVLNHAGARVLVTEPELVHLVEQIRPRLGCRNFLLAAPRSHPGWQQLDAVSSAAEPFTAPVDMGADGLLRLMYTSGTTSRPKGVMITNGNLEAKSFGHIIELGLGPHDRGLLAGPLYHVGALDLTFTTLLYLGAEQYLHRQFVATDVIRAIDAMRISTMWLAPAMVRLLMQEELLAQSDMSSLRVLIDGGETMPRPLIERVHAVFPAAWFADAYGLTETVSGDTFLNKAEATHKLGSVGKPVFNTDVEIVDVDGRVLQAGEVGEIVLRGPKVCAGYWRDPDSTAAALKNGALRTGDIGYLDDEGYLYVVDRLKDVIVSGGENIASLEVERALHESPLVAEVAVIGAPDAKWGEVPVGYVVPGEGTEINEAELIAFCAERLARFKVPRRIRVIGELPRNPSGKVLKRRLRELEANQPAGTDA